jgi:diguanylate cyclase (GGDEF)-like protein
VQEPSIAIIGPLQPEDFFDLLWQGVWEATFDLAAFGVQVRNLTTERHDVAGQQEILTQLLEDKVDGIAIVPAHRNALDRLIDQHESLNTPVVTFRGDAPDSRRSAYVGPDAFQAGVLAGELLVKLMGGQGRVLSFPGSIAKYHLEQRELGLRAELASHADCSVVTASTPDLEQYDVFPLELLEALEAANGFYVGGQDLAKVAAALEQSGVRAPCIGFGNTQPVQAYLARQTVSAVIDDHRYLQGYFAVQKAYEAILKRRQGSAVAGIRIPSDVAFAANAAGSEDSLHFAFETLVRQRTEALVSYKQRLEQANVELLSLSVTDPLTGLLNRRKFEETIRTEVARAQRYGPLSLLMIDLNFFKLVNDRHGHPAGDEVLKRVAVLLKACCRETDTCARLGGDEFAVILPHTDRAAAEVVRERIQKEAAWSTIAIDGEELPLSLSVGIGGLLPDAENADALIAAADADMYQAKRASRQQLVGQASGLS